ncbi:MAG: hypothetical protein ABFD07_05185, partial [Methanobacterium sp.]
MEINRAQFYHSVRICGREHQTVVAGINGIHPDTKMYFVDNLVVVDEPDEDELVIVGLTNTRSFRVSKDKLELFVFSRENSIPSLVSIEDIDISNLKHDPICATDEVMEKVASIEN